MLKISTIRPGLLVSLRTTVQGNASYARQDIEPEHIEADGTKRHVVETTKTVRDPIEHDAALKVRSKARSLISAVCCQTEGGLLCPEADAAKLQAAVAEARALTDKFNASANLTRVGIFVYAGRVADNDVDAIRSINAEVRDLLGEMQQGVQSLDPERIRAAASKAKQLGAMLSPEAAKRAQTAIDAVRSAARIIVKGGETASLEIDTGALQRIKEARTAFLDLDEGAEIKAPVIEGRGIDLEPVGPALLDQQRKLEAAPSLFSALEL